MEYMERGFDCGDGRCRDMFWEFVCIVIIPGSVLFIGVFITSVLMCCHSCKRRKSEVITDETQMLQYNSIRRASISLRQLSHNRDTPLLSARADRDARAVSLNLERDPRYRRGGRGTASAPGTLQRDRERHHRHQRERHSDIPPQYSTPPGGRCHSQGELNQGSDSGVQYAELNHGVMAAASLSDSNHERLVN